MVWLVVGAVAAVLMLATRRIRKRNEHLHSAGDVRDLGSRGGF